MLRKAYYNIEVSPYGRWKVSYDDYEIGHGKEETQDAGYAAAGLTCKQHRETVLDDRRLKRDTIRQKISPRDIQRYFPQ